VLKKKLKILRPQPLNKVYNSILPRDGAVW
jgi:hypothetical protein